MLEILDTAGTVSEVLTFAHHNTVKPKISVITSTRLVYITWWIKNGHPVVMSLLNSLLMHITTVIEAL